MVQVDTMQKELIDLQPKLKEATIATDALIVQIDKDTIEANAKKVTHHSSSYSISSSLSLSLSLFLKYLLLIS